MSLPSLMDASRYVGRPYIVGEFDCGSLAVLVQRELFNRAVGLVPACDRSRGRRGQARIVTGHDLGVQIDGPETGCVAILWETTAAGRPPYNRSYHIGTVFMQDNVPWLLHASNATRGVVLQRLRDVTSHSMHLDGFYKWHSTPLT